MYGLIGLFIKAFVCLSQNLALTRDFICCAICKETVSQQNLPVHMYGAHNFLVVNIQKCLESNKPAPTPQEDEQYFSSGKVAFSELKPESHNIRHAWTELAIMLRKISLQLWQMTVFSKASKDPEQFKIPPHLQSTEQCNSWCAL